MIATERVRSIICVEVMKVTHGRVRHQVSISRKVKDNQITIKPMSKTSINRRKKRAKGESLRNTRGVGEEGLRVGEDWRYGGGPGSYRQHKKEDATEKTEQKT